MDIINFDYDLPSDLIAQTPTIPRDESRLLSLIGSGYRNLTFSNLPSLMNSGDIFYSKDVLEKLAKICLNNKNYKIVFGDTMVSNGVINYKVKSEYFNNKTILMPFCHQSSAVRSNLLKNNLFNLKYTLSSDFNFFSLC